MRFTSAPLLLIAMGLLTSCGDGSSHSLSDRSAALKRCIQSIHTATSSHRTSYIVEQGILSSTSDPVYTAPITVYDSIGNSDKVQFEYRSVPVGAAAPVGAASRRDWTAMYLGRVLATNNSPGNSPLFFDANGRGLTTKLQTIPISPFLSSPFTFTVDFSPVTADNSLDLFSVMAEKDSDGYPLGTLRGCVEGADGKIYGAFSSGELTADLNWL